MQTGWNSQNRRRHLWVLTLVALLACVLIPGTAAAAPSTGALVQANEAAPKPIVTIQGNVVVEKNKPTGFYELALCVKTARTIEDEDGNPVTEEAYKADIEANPDNAVNYKITNYPFQSAAATVRIDLDSLTAVTWGAGKPIYDGWTATGATGTAGTYDADDTAYPRGIDTANPDQPAIFTDLSPVLNSASDSVRVRLDTAKPDEVTNADAHIEQAEFDAGNPGKRTALLTLTANTTTTANVVYEESTPVVVVRFAYDLNRFTKTDVTAPNSSDFWVGLDRNAAGGPNTTGQRPLTYLAEGDQSSGDLYAASDLAAARASVGQTVLYSQNILSDGVSQKTTSFYYYLGADPSPSIQDTTGSAVQVFDNGMLVTPDPVLIIPKTLGHKVLAKRVDADPVIPGVTAGLNGDYSFFQNLLKKDESLVLELVNAETYRKPTGGIGGAQILFYDWDDSLIGALVVDPEGDARAAVNEYVERVMIHPDLHTEDAIANAKDLTELQGDQDYLDRVNSLERQYTYRGEYAYQVGQDSDDTLKVDNGGNYPLTNKLDYAFYRRNTKQIEAVDPGTGENTRYFVANPVSAGDGGEDYDGYLYPYVNGWAIVEDETQDLTKDNWILHKDSVKTEDVWTTFGVGELANLDPDAAGAGTISDGNGNTYTYNYAVSENDAAWYLRFADFSAMEKMLREGQDVLIVKAVYEPGESLLPSTHYTTVEDSLHVERYSYAASTGASVYSFQYQYRRASQEIGGVWRGVGRTREPAVQTGYTYDVNAFDSENKDLDPTIDTNAFFMKTISNNNDILDIDLTTGGVLWKIDYLLVDIYGANISSGAQRSAGGELDLKNNFLYEDDVEYPDRQGTDGFVLEATLNTLLAEATKAAKGEAGNLSTHMMPDTITDLNLRWNVNGDEFDWGNYDVCATYLQDLVTRLYNAGVSIDPKTGDVKLGWHQIQRHILMCMQAGGSVDGIFSGGVLMSEEACAGFSWCRLDDCGLIITVDIFDLGDIFVAMDKAKDETGDKHPAKDALDKLLTETPSLLDGYLNQFRKDEDGRKFKTRQEMLDALEKVYDILSDAGLTQDEMKAITTEQVQELIIEKKYPTTGKTYWWMTGDGKRPISTWEDFIKAGMLVVSGDVPDALDGMTNEKLPTAVQDMISYAAPTGSPSNVGWFRYKDSQDEDNEYADVEAFKADWLEALKVLRTKYALPQDWDTIPWEEIQYALIHHSYKDVTSILQTEDYWWKGGGLPKLTYEKLLAAANEYRKSGYSDSSELDRLLAKGINPVNNEVYLRRTVAGSGFNDADSFKAALRNALTIIDYTANSGTFVNPVTGEVAVDVYQMQYLLLNANKLVGQNLPGTQEIQDTAGYWWIPEPHLPTAAQRINDIMDLMTYAFWQRDGVGGKTPAELGFDPLGQLDAATMERLGLRAEEHGMPYTDESNATLIAQVLAALNKLPYTIDNFGNQSAADLTREMQYALLHGAYQPSGSITEDYWWQGSGFVAETHETLAQAAWLAAVGFNGKTAADAMNNITDLDFITRRETIDAPGMAMRSDMNGTAFISIDTFKTTLTNAIKGAADSGMTYADLAGMTNYQLQYLLINGVYKTDAAVKAEVIVDGVDAYWWFTSDNPPEPDVQKEPIEIDPAEWDAFLNSAIAYYKKTAGNPSGFVYDLTDEKLKDVLRLRKGPNDSDVITAAEMFSGDKSDLLWQVMSALHTSSRKSYFITGAATNRKWMNKPTWAEFQYVLLHLNDVGSGWVMPDTDACEAAKDGYDWMWKVTGGKVEYERVSPPDAEWGSFLDSAIAYYKKTAGNPSGFVYDLTDEGLKDTLLLRTADGAEITAGEMFAGNKTDLLWQVMSALHTSSRKSEFITGAATNRKWVNKPTWAEFQYVLLHLNDVGSGWVMPSTAACEEWATQENTPWAWKEKAAGASLFELEELEELEDEPVPKASREPTARPEVPPEEAELPAEAAGEETFFVELGALPIAMTLLRRNLR